MDVVELPAAINGLCHASHEPVSGYEFSQMAIAVEPLLVRLTEDDVAYWPITPTDDAGALRH
jgi:hypothetical protein